MSDFQRGRREVVEGCTDIPREKIKPGTTLAGGKQSHLSGTSRRDRPGVSERGQIRTVRVSFQYSYELV